MKVEGEVEKGLVTTIGSEFEGKVGDAVVWIRADLNLVGSWVGGGIAGLDIAILGGGVDDYGIGVLIS